MYLFVLHGVQSWLVAILEARGVAVEVAGSVTALLVVGQVIGVLAIPTIAERFGRTRATVIGCGLLGALGALGLLVVPSVVLLLAIPIIFVGLGVGGLSPLIRSIPVELNDIGPALTGTAVGLVYAFGEIGGFLAPVLMGALRDTTGSFTSGIVICAIAALIAAGAGVALSAPAKSS